MKGGLKHIEMSGSSLRTGMRMPLVRAALAANQNQQRQFSIMAVPEAYQEATKLMKIVSNKDIPKDYKTMKTDDYLRRHLGNTERDTQEMCDYLGVKNVEELMNETVPEQIRLPAKSAFKHNG